MPASFRNPLFILVCGALVLGLAIGIRSTFGLFLRPVTLDMGWNRESFAMALAVQNLLWGVFQPPVGMIADKWGSGKVIALGGVLYALGVYLMSTSASVAAWNISAGLVVGAALSATTFGVTLGAVGRAFTGEKRSSALGIASAGGSAGHFMMLILGGDLLSRFSWQTSLGVMAMLAMFIIPLSLVLTGKGEPEGTASQDMGEALKEAGTNGSYLLLTVAFFVCGFQVMFIGAHLPAFLMDNSITPSMAALAMGLIGFFNIVGSYLCGYFGGRYSKRLLLSGIYLARAVVVSLFLVVPLSTVSILIFSGAIGFLWLGTVPLTSGLVAQIFGMQYMSTLFGFVFFGHQVGSFFGVWLGAVAYDLQGNYDLVWYGTIALGLLAALLHLPIKEGPIKRPAEATG